MIEVVFDTCAAGSLRVAMGTRTYSSGPVSVACLGDDAGGPPEREARDMQRKFEERERQKWEKAILLAGDPEDVLTFSLQLNEGAIDEDCIGRQREETLRRYMSTYPSAIADGEVEKQLKDSRRNLQTLLRRASAGEPIRVWCGSNACEVSGTYWLMEQLSTIGFENLDVTMVKLPDFQEQCDGTVVMNTCCGELEPSEWGELAQQGIKLPANYMRALADQWVRLKRENAPLRAVLNGRLVSMPETLYDPFILRELDAQPEEFPEAGLVGHVLGRYQLGIGDAWIAERIETLIQDGLLQPITEPEEGDPIYRRMLRKCIRQP